MLSRSGPSSGRRGPDNKRWDGTVAGSRGTNKVLSVDEARLLKTQDVGYIRTVRNTVAKQVEALRQRVMLAEGRFGEGQWVDVQDGGDSEDEDMDVLPAKPKRKAPPPAPKRVVFASTADEQQQAAAAAAAAAVASSSRQQRPPQPEDDEDE